MGFIGWVDERREEGCLSFFLAFSEFFLGVFSVGTGCCIVRVKPDRLVIIGNSTFKVSKLTFGSTFVYECRVAFPGASTPQISDLSDYADFKRSSVS